MVGKKRTGNDRETSKTQIHTHTLVGRRFYEDRENNETTRRREKERGKIFCGGKMDFTRKKKENACENTQRDKKKRKHTRTRAQFFCDFHCFERSPFAISISNYLLVYSTFFPLFLQRLAATMIALDFPFFPLAGNPFGFCCCPCTPREARVKLEGNEEAEK